jgi:hypothetical protein
MSKIIRLSWNGATDDKGIKAYELLYSLAPNFNNWQQAAIINTTQSNVSYDFEVKDYVDHRFSIRTIDTIGQYSDYKYVTQTVDPVPSFISSTSSATIGTCDNPTYTPTNIINIYSNNSLIGNTDVLSGNIVKTEGNLTFNGYGRNWGITHYNKSYSCAINTSGVITESNACRPMWTINSYTNPNLTFTRNYGTDSSVTVQRSTNSGASWGDSTGSSVSPRNIGSYPGGTWIRLKSISDFSLSNVLIVPGQPPSGPSMSPSVLSTGQSSGLPSSSSPENGYMNTTEYFAFYLTVNVGAVAGCSITPRIRINGSIVWTGPTLSTKYQVANVSYFHTGTGPMTVALEATYTGTGNSANVTMKLTP